jgi:hypothetical protein
MQSDQAMPEPTFDGHGYPTEDACEAVAKWPAEDLTGLFAFLKAAWWMADWGWREPEPGKFEVSTGGWSGNEDLICSLQENYLAWSLCWQSSRRGGHYEFAIPENLRRTPDAK